MTSIEKIKQVAWIGDAYLEGEIKGIMLAFHGLGFCGDKQGPDTIELELAKRGWLVVFPYYGPWSWMNRESRTFVDNLIDSIYECYSLDKDIPIVSTGGSMGGLSSLIYTRYAKRPIAACFALYPVCDFEYHFSERPDLPKTIYYAFRSYNESMPELFTEHSPLAQVDNMPDIPYLIVHGDIDKAVNKEIHSDRFVSEMRKRNMNVEYIEIKGMDHGWALPLETIQRVIVFIDQNI